MVTNMGNLQAGIGVHRRAVVLGAAVLLPLSTAAATAPAATLTPTPVTPSSTSSLVARPVSGAHLPAIQAPDVAKAVPVSSTPSRGHVAVVVGTAKQRVAQVSATTSYDLPQAALNAYRRAANSVATSSPSCHLSWTLLAAIGQVESDNGRYGGAVVLANGDVTPHILGPVLNGTGDVAAIRDSDGGRYDGDPVWDRAVGPMQFIPGTWAGYGADGNSDGVRDPNNIADAALAAARYLCTGAGDLRVDSQLRATVMRYNHSVAYVDLVLRLARAYASGAATIISNGTATRQAEPDSTLTRHRVHESNAPTRTVPPNRQHARKPADHGGEHTRGEGGSGGSGTRGTSGPPTAHSPRIKRLPTPTRPTSPTPPTTQPPTTQPTPPPGTDPTKPTRSGNSTPPRSKPGHTHQGHTHQGHTHQGHSHQGHSHQGHTGPGHRPPDQVLATGVLQSCTSGWCVGETALDFGPNADFTAHVGDLNADGRAQSLKRELKSLAGSDMTVILVLTEESPTHGNGDAHSGTTDNGAADNGAVQHAPAQSTAPATEPDQALPQPSSGSNGKPVPIAVTVGADGIVTSINGVTLLTS
jgi:membrane-bound lytic murein transglycosylase B